MEKLLVIASLGQRAYGRWLFQRLLSGILAVFGLVLIIAIMISATLVACLYAAFVSLIYYGAPPHIAMVVTTLCAILIILMLIILALSCMHHLRQMPKTLIKDYPLTSRVMSALDAFTDGLMAE